MRLARGKQSSTLNTYLKSTGPEQIHPSNLEKKLRNVTIQNQVVLLIQQRGHLLLTTPEKIEIEFPCWTKIYFPVLFNAEPVQHLNLEERAPLLVQRVFPIQTRVPLRTVRVGLNVRVAGFRSGA